MQQVTGASLCDRPVDSQLPNFRLYSTSHFLFHSPSTSAGNATKNKLSCTAEETRSGAGGTASHLPALTSAENAHLRPDFLKINRTEGTKMPIYYNNLMSILPH